jgi:AraC-like DNA-binding protein
MNGYNLIRAWFNYKFEHPDKAKAIHSELFCYIVDLWNRFGQKEKFNLPTFNTMELLGIGSRNTYYKAVKDLEDFGFIKTITNSKNHHTSRVITISKFKQVPIQALDQATIQVGTQVTYQVESTEINNITTNNKQVKEDLLNSEIWLNTIGKNKNLSLEQVKVSLNNFLSILEMQDELHKSEKEIKKHFINWLGKQNNLDLQITNNKRGQFSDTGW